jgi:hypothetical protein
METAPQIVSELKRYILFELDEVERKSIQGVTNERDLYEIIKQVGAKLLFRDTDWINGMHNKMDDYYCGPSP